MVDNHILVKWEDVENDVLRLRTNLAEERRVRVQVEKDKKAIEQELESLTTALFEEANQVVLPDPLFLRSVRADTEQMVAATRKEAKKDKEGLERRNEQLQAQLNDAELLLASHQEQLAELKQAMQDMSHHRNELETLTNVSTAPSTPAPEMQDQTSKVLDAFHLSSNTPTLDDIPPAPPTNFTHLISPVLRTDVQAFDDFHALLDVSRRSGPPSRVTSGNYGAFNGLGLSNVGKSEQSQIASRMPSNGSTSSLAASNTYHSSPGTPNLAPSTSTSISSRDMPTSGAPLKETAFYKRVLTEDIEPTLRLDVAPGLSWLARRGVISSIIDGKLIIEPTPTNTKHYQPPCSLCGEQGRTERQARRHRFRTNESETAQRYPLCEYCLNRVRSTCDFLGFLRMVKDGYWRTDGPQAESLAWEESVRLRERMFWSRIGGGVVPAFLRIKAESPRTSSEQPKDAANSTGSQTSLISAEQKLEKPLESKQSSDSQPPQIRDQEIPSDPQLSDTHEQVTRPKSPSPEKFGTEKGNAIPPDVHEITPANGSAPRTMPQESASSSPQVSDPPPSSRPPTLSRTTTRSRGSSRTEGSGRTINSIAKRAAMFERSSSNDSVSRQLHGTLQASLKSQSPNRGPSIPGAFD